MAFLGAACEPPGADAVDAIVLGERPDGLDVVAVRAHENEVLQSLAGEDVARVDQVCEQMFSVNRTAFGRAYRKHAQQTAWDGIRLFLLGGGTRINAVRRRLCKRPWEGLLQDPPIVDPGHPNDLYEMNGERYAGEPTFLLVAYGLSHLAADVPTASSPSEISEFRPQLPRLELDHEEIYAK